MPSAEAVVLGEVLVGVLAVFREKAIAAGVAADEVERMIADSVAKVQATKPEDLPDGR